MKNLTNLFIVILLMGSGYFVWTKVLPDFDPFSLDDAYRLNIDSSDQAPSPQMKIQNNSDINLRLHMFNASDSVKLVARENWVLKPGESKHYPRGNYVFHVWKSQLFDASIVWTDTLWTDVEFSGNANNLVVKGSAKPPVTITNDVNEQLKACAYNTNDLVQAISLVPCWTLGPQTSVTWQESPDVFMLKVFKPALLDDPILTQSGAKDVSSITITHGKQWWKFW